MKRKPIYQTLAGLLLGLMLAACSSGSSPQATGLKVQALDTLKYNPTTLTAKVGQSVTVTLENKGFLDHTFVSDELNAKIEVVKAGATGTVTFTPTAAGTYTYYCNVPGHKDGGMVGTLTVTP